MSLHEDTQGQPLPSVMHQSSSGTSQLHLQTGLGRQFTLEALKTQYLGWQHLSENKSDPHFVFFSLS